MYSYFTYKNVKENVDNFGWLLVFFKVNYIFVFAFTVM